MNAQADNVMAALPPVKYNITDSALAELKTRLAGTDARQDYEAAKEALKECTSLRTALEARRKDLKKDALEYGRKVDSEAKRILAKILEVEEPIKATKEAVDAEAACKEAERQAAIDAEYQNIVDYGENLFGATADKLQKRLEGLQAHELDEDKLQERYHEARKAKDAIVERLSAKLVEAEQAEREAAELKAQREAQAAEEKRLAEERRKIEEAQRKQREEQAAIEREKRELAEAKEAQERAEIEAKARAERERHQKEAREKAEREERERIEALKPDKDKLLKVAAQLRDFKLPKMKTTQGDAACAYVRQELDEIAARLEDEMQ